MINEIDELTYIKKYYNLFDTKIENFVSSEILEENIKQEFDQEIALDDPFKNARITEPENKKLTDIDSLDCIKKKKKKKENKSWFWCTKLKST